MSKEAIKLALDALECALSDDKPYIDKSKEAIKALEEALAQEQCEPVAWCRYEDGVWVYYETKAWDDLQPLYTTPQQRTWVGLTEPEVDECYESIMFDPDIKPSRMGVYLEIEAKLKEKNGIAPQASAGPITAEMKAGPTPEQKAQIVEAMQAPQGRDNK
jgi:hypothetical protein